MILKRDTWIVSYSLKRRVFRLAVCVVMVFALLVLLNVVIVYGADRSEFTKGEAKSILERQSDIESRIDIYPPLPKAGDAITITSSGIWVDTCVPEYQSHQIIDNVIRIDTVIPGGICFPAFWPWTSTVGITLSHAGFYTVQVYITRLYLSLTPTLHVSTTFTVVPVLTSTIIYTDGGELTYRYSDHVTSLTVPPGALSAPSVFTISYRTPPTTTGQLLGMDHFFDLVSTQSLFAVPLTLTVRYSEGVRGVIISGTENLYRWEGGRWVTENITLTDRWPGGLSAQITHLSLFGVLGETNRVYLPIMLKYETGDKSFLRTPLTK